ncbi:hypothetical protein [Sphingobacterium kitahiroshimense]|uniref:DUF4252 domain-containing protein n=1 Tax=Sphingobacterium kitahiroshimense TaxID=470446 RepID=A0ABV0BPN3_9SPHI
MKIYSLILVLLLLTISTKAQTVSDDQIQIKKFISEIVKEDLSDKELVGKYFVIEKKNVKRALEILSLQFQYLRKTLADENFENIMVVPYASLPEEQQDHLTKQETDKNCYQVFYNRDKLINIMLIDNKVRGFGSLNKGGVRMIIKY